MLRHLNTMSLLWLLWLSAFPMITATDAVVAEQQAPQPSNEEDSLKGALEAVTRRQRDLSSEYGRHLKDYDETTPELDEESPYANQEASYGYGDSRSSDFERALIDYLREKGVLDNERMSPFRERAEEDRERQREQIVEILQNREDEEYVENLRRLFDKYRKAYLENYEETPSMYNAPTKRTYFGSLGWNSVGMSKRSRYFQPDGPTDSLHLLNYAPRDEYINRLEDDEEDTQNNSWNSGNVRFPRERRWGRFSYPYIRKRFPVTKRSSDFYRMENGETIQQDQTPKTDPKVEKELSDIFNAKIVKPTSEDKKSKVKQSLEKPKKFIGANKKKSTEEKNKNEESSTSVPSSVSKPLDMKKKSIDWSDYFGLDRRKKSNNEGDDKEWLLEKYHKSLTVADKRNVEYPLKNFRDHSEKKKKVPGKDKDVDEKLENMEESAIDDALKFTGAHIGTNDASEIQFAKDRILSRLADAYRFEKMRRALASYHQTMQMGDRFSNSIDDTDVNGLTDPNLREDKRGSVARKQAIDTFLGLDCEDNKQVLKTCPWCVKLEQLIQKTKWSASECPELERVCSDEAAQISTFGSLLEPACDMYQTCQICTEPWAKNTQFTCQLTYHRRVKELCNGNHDCTVEGFRLMDRLPQWRTRPDVEECNIPCPDER